ncbi:MAG: radical SAM protein [Desulfurococcales archaeon]|nr:radical SAM protein [Desulfurococcales archaeon]
MGNNHNEPNEKKGDIGRLLTGIRLIFNNPLTRSYLRTGTKRVECCEEDKCREQTLLFHALSSFTGSNVTGCPITARFLSWMIKSTIKIGVKVLKGDIESAKEALRDPAVRRGVSLVVEGLARYGVTVPQKMPAPFLIVWNFTNMCNLKCIHCYQRADKPLPDELTLEEKLEAVRQIDKAGVAAVALSGGEPTIHPHFYRIVKELADRDIYVSVATNGTMFAKIENLEKAVKAGIRYVEVSVDSANPEVHDRFRGVPGAWEKATQALRNAVKLGVNNGMATTVTKFNINEIEEILDLAEEIGVNRVIFFNFVPTGRGADYAWMDLTPEEREEFLKTIYKEMKKRKLEIESTAPQYARVVLEMSQGEEVAPTHFYVGSNKIVNALAEFVGGCGAGRIYAALQPNGDVAPCVFLPIKTGNIREKPFREIWDTSEVFQTLRNRELLKGYCGECPYKYVCGGCRARAYAYFQDITAPDPGCILNKKEWEKIPKPHVTIRQPTKPRGSGGGK